MYQIEHLYSVVPVSEVDLSWSQVLGIGSRINFLVLQ